MPSHWLHQRHRKVTTKGEVILLQFLKPPIGSLESPRCCRSGFNLSFSPGLCVDFQSHPLRFVSSPKSWLQRLGVRSFGKTASQEKVRIYMLAKQVYQKRSWRVGWGGMRWGGMGMSFEQKRKLLCVLTGAACVNQREGCTGVLEACSL